MIKKGTVEFCVGLFLLIGAICAGVLFFKVGGVDDVNLSRGYYTITTEFNNVGTLKEKSKIIMSGVTVGRVSKIEFKKDSFTAKVTMIIDQRIDNLPIDTEARIVTAGLLGDKYIGLVGGYDSSGYLKEGSSIPIENTESALLLEDLVGKFLAGKASGS